MSVDDKYAPVKSFSLRNCNESKWMVIVKSNKKCEKNVEWTNLYLQYQGSELNRSFPFIREVVPWSSSASVLPMSQIGVLRKIDLKRSEN